MNNPSLPFPVRQDANPFDRLRLLAGPVSSIVDGGANKGRTVARFLELFPHASVTAYEPSPRLARKLAKRFADDPRVKVRPVALGSGPARLTLNVLQSETCNSLLAPTGIRDKHAGKPMDVATTVEVEVVRLDRDMTAPPDILKLDLQGYELEALRGAQGFLDRMACVLCEVSFRDLYRGQPMGGEVIAWMDAKGFRLEGLYSPWRDASGALVSADALFTRV